MFNYISLDSIISIKIALTMRYLYSETEELMKMSRLVIQIPVSMKDKLDAIRATGTTAAGLIRHLLNQHFNQQPTKGQKER